jgi:hypothetical protein
MKSTYTYLNRSNIRRHLYVFIILQASLLASIIVNLSGINWLSYCVWRFGLLKVDYIGGEVDASIDHHITNSDTIDYIVNTTCEHDDIYINYFCNNICTNIKRVAQANYQVIVTCSIVLGISLIIIGFYLYRIFRINYRSRLVVVVPIVQVGIYFLGMLLFLGSIHFKKWVSVDCKGHIECEDFELKEGFIYFVVNGVAMIAVNSYGFWKTRMAFIID